MDMMNSEPLQELVYLGTITYDLIITLLALVYITVALRLWVRFRITKTPGWDDISMVATLLLFTCYCAFIFVVIFRSRERRLFSPDSIRITLVFIQLSEVFYILTTTLLKVSLGLFFLRVLTAPWQTRIFHTLLSVSTMYGFVYALITIFQCGNPSKVADSLLGSPKCLPGPTLLATGYLYGSINVLADWTFVLIPISVLVGSDLDRKSKISVSMVMALGAVGSVSSIMRMVYLHGLALNGGKGLLPSSIKATIWATAEPGTGIIAASVAILRPLLRVMASVARRKVISFDSNKNCNLSESETIALASQKPSIYSGCSVDFLSPTVVVGQVIVQSVMSVRTADGREIPKQMRVFV
ncbi:hypothetical protein IAQ61_005261 [Plenodomus lingam]|uniref:Rhodopsin domain-containing protein n=1 Tax=Leptosphaeria maculans (strain JN3 / isolate v23.1.3 / race Av1-4-5-6-7-8) TaxID=985895 RepID=E5A791_LEPMJ|nr:predicted protein [Plenodomus lingam JN3]KAH9872426.1 hypothetical protein IAQ61_005261 [Plenodomus lingam]CBX99486.1 predicted protein [Plenodomus lingam JN3]